MSKLRLQLEQERLSDLLRIARDALRKNRQYWQCVCEMEDAKYCAEYAQIADEATDNALVEIDRWVNESD